MSRPETAGHGDTRRGGATSTAPRPDVGLVMRSSRSVDRAVRWCEPSELNSQSTRVAPRDATRAGWGSPMTVAATSTDTRGRRTRAEIAAQTREAILQASCEVIAETGFENIRMRMVADRAGVSTAALHYH